MVLNAELVDEENPSLDVFPLQMYQSETEWVRYCIFHGLVDSVCKLQWSSVCSGGGLEVLCGLQLYFFNFFTCVSRAVTAFC